MTLPSDVMVDQIFFGSFCSRNFLIGIFPTKHNHWLSLRLALGRLSWLAIALTSGFVIHPMGNNDLDN
jgi:hypothetical protein